MAKLKPKVFTARWYHHLIARFNWALILGAALILIFFSYQYIFKVRREMEKSGGSLDLSYYEKNLEKEKEYLKNLKTLKEETDKAGSLIHEIIVYTLFHCKHLYVNLSFSSVNITNFQNT